MSVFNPHYRKFKLPRKWSNAELKKIAPLFDGDVINVSGWDDRDKMGGKYRGYFIKCNGYYISNYKGTRGMADAGTLTDFEIDLEESLPDQLHNKFDVVFNHTTLEHVFDVFKAFENLCRMSKDVVILVLPFTQEIHTSDSFGDYWRFTPMAIRKLFSKNGFTSIYEAANNHSDSGNYILVVGSRNPEKWKGRLPAYREVNHLSDWIGNPGWFKLLRRLLGKSEKAPVS